MRVGFVNPEWNALGICFVFRAASSQFRISYLKTNPMLATQDEGNRIAKLCRPASAVIVQGWVHDSWGSMRGAWLFNPKRRTGFSEQVSEEWYFGNTRNLHFNLVQRMTEFCMNLLIM